MSGAKRLLEAATPLPWKVIGQRVEPDHSEHSFTGVQFSHHEDAELVVYAVNALPDYEAAVEALERFVESHEAGYPASIVLSEEACDAARAALRRLRESVPA